MKIKFKNIFITIIAVANIFVSVQINAESVKEKSAVERIYIVTDRSAYLAGESLWMSVYCFDLSKNRGTFSELSSVAYIELQNENGLTATAKIHLNNGKGSGKIDLPPSLPTGNYKLIGYTKQMRNEESLNYSEKTISIFNTLTNDRVDGNVVVPKTNSSDIPVAEPLLIANSSKVEFITNNELKVNSSYPVTLKNNSDKKMFLTFSVSRIDNLPMNNNESLATFLSAREWNLTGTKLSQKYTPEYEGEIIDGTVKYDREASYLQYIAFFSAVGNEPNVYTSYVDTTGKIAFYTNSIFGDREAVLEIPSADTNSSSSFEINDQFVKPKLGEFPKLYLNQSLELALRERSIEMQLGRRFGEDTLFEKMKIRKDPLLNASPKVYMLDDYTRFPVMSEVMVEYIPELRFRKVDKMTDLQVRWTDAMNSITFSRGATLALIDGIPVFKHQRIYDYDPLKIKSISIYGGEFLIGAAKYDGIVMFKSYKGDYPGLKFSKNAKIFDFQGVQFPCRFSADKVISKENLPDLRSLLYWDPQIEISKDDSSKFVIHTSGLSGRFLVKIEGLTEDGEAVFYTKIIEVK